MRLFRGPVLCNYYLTYRCNAKCGFCDIWERPSPYVDPEDLKANLLDLRKLGVKVIDFTGGEPLLHQQLPEFLSFARELGFITSLTTNTLLYPKMAEKLRGKVDMLHFSLDSPDASLHNESRGVDCFDHLQESIRIAKKMSETPDILFTVIPENIHEITEVWEKYVVQEGLLLKLNPVFSYNKVGGELSSDELDKLMLWGNKKGVYLNKAFIELRKNGGNSIQDPICKAASTTVVISPNNDLIIPCYHLEIESFPIQGNLFDLWNSDKVRRESAKEGTLPGCEGCVINCYMEPSFTYNINKWFFRSLPSTLKYSLEKWVYA